MSDQTESLTMVAVHELHKSFGAVNVLRGVSLSARQGDVIAVIGASGCGKTTLLRCINLLELPTRGRIVIGNEELLLEKRGDGNLHAQDSRQLRRLRSRVGMVFQHFNLWAHMSVVQNVMEAPMQVLGLSRIEAQKRALNYLLQVKLSHKHDAYPIQLSGGEQQRVAIARALAVQPMVLLFDEPTSALDPVLSAEVLHIMRNLALQGRTMIIASHDMELVKAIASEVVFLENGLLGERGPPDRLFKTPKTLALKKFLGKEWAGEFGKINEAIA